MARGRRKAESPLSLFALQDIITCLMGIMVLVCLFLALQTIGKANATPARSSGRADLIGLERERERLEAKRMAFLEQIENAQAAQQVVSTLNPIEIAAATQSAQRENEELRKKIHQLKEVTTGKEAGQQEKTDKLERQKNKLGNLVEQLGIEKKSAEFRAMKKVAFIPDQNLSKTPYLVECSSISVRVVQWENHKEILWASSDAKTKFKEWLPSLNADRVYFVFMLKPSGVGIGMSLYHVGRDAGFDAGYDALEEDATILAGASL